MAKTSVTVFCGDGEFDLDADARLRLGAAGWVLAAPALAKNHIDSRSPAKLMEFRKRSIVVALVINLWFFRRVLV